MTTYGRSRDAAYRAKNLQFKAEKSTYSVFRSKECLGDIELNVPGEHNVLNSLAAVVLGLEMGLSFQNIKNGIKRYKGVRRRFDIKGLFNNILIVDDYAHHPSEVKATISSAKAGWNRRIIAVFQPHLFSRTKEFFKEFAEALKIADIVIISEIYGAREEPIKGVTSQLIFFELKKKMKNKCILLSNLNELEKTINGIIKPGDLLLTMGAGDIWRYNEYYVEQMKRRFGKV